MRTNKQYGRQRATRHGNGLVLDVTKCPVYSRIREKKSSKERFLKIIHHQPIYLVLDYIHL